MNQQQTAALSRKICTRTMPMKLSTLLERLQNGSCTVMQALESEAIPDSIWHLFVCACAKRLLQQHLDQTQHGEIYEASCLALRHKFRWTHGACTTATLQAERQSYIQKTQPTRRKTQTNIFTAPVDSPVHPSHEIRLLLCCQAIEMATLPHTREAVRMTVRIIWEIHRLCAASELDWERMEVKEHFWQISHLLALLSSTQHHRYLLHSLLHARASSLQKQLSQEQHSLEEALFF